MPENEALFGHVAVELGVITKNQLVDVTRLQNDPEEARSLGQLLIELGWANREQLGQVIAEQKRRQTQAEPPPPPQVSEIAETTGAATGVRAPSRVAAATITSLEQILRQAVELDASDIHIHSGSQLRNRIHGHFVSLTTEPLSAEFVEGLVREVLDEARLGELERSGQVDLSIAVPDLARFRVNAYRQQNGLDLVLRVIPGKVRDLEQLGLGNELARFTTYHQGLVLVTGPSGCGKTSTLAALVNIINQERRDHIITAEDPIEYIHVSKRCIVNQRQVEVHSASFPRILRAALREDPDVIVLGELRDLATVSLALTAAETGHLVLGTLHTGGAIRTINRLIGLFPANEQEQMRIMLAESLRAVISQRLIPRADGSGRVPAVEIMLVTRAISNLIRENKVFQIQSLLQTGRSKGMRQLSESVEDLIKAGVITQQEAQKHV